MIKNIIFDIGQVLAKFRWEDYIKDLQLPSDISERLAKATVLSPYWDEADRGAKTQEELIELFVSNDPEIEEQIRIFFRDTTNIVTEFDYSKEWVQSLKNAGYHIYILSNYGEVNFTHAKDRFTFLPYVDGAVISYQEKCIKPEPEIYEILLDRYHLKGEECVFLDDRQVNLEGAEKFHIATILFQNVDQAKQDLAKLGIFGK